ncbi:Hypothetical predicted protein [Lecanosticta acicola]|uniref:Uncharacterized protein n=1 Tax=Lecanosticta acicola TaxID=111012 RepID=A0AAI8Z0M7_9PEZI|nr:Hypothetical predicted protein [Lecanosticta acicola]
MHRIPALLALPLAVSTPASAHALELQIQNPNHIFNAIHSSMRQWGSSLNHNGMSYFLATIPQGTQLYHGTDTPDRVNGTEWLAFEPEHASMFARPRRAPPGRGGPPGPPPNHASDDEDDWHPPQAPDEHSNHKSWYHGPPPHDGPSPDAPPPGFSDEPRDGWKHGLRRRDHGEDQGDRPRTHTAAQREHARQRVEQNESKKSAFKFGSKKPDPNEDAEAHGYLHTYRPKHDLRLLYIDGQSAAKSDKGTLDSQDVVLLHDNPPSSGAPHHGPPPPPPPPPHAQDEPKKRHGGPMNEASRAEQLCAMAQREWKGRIDGFLRMELGFEIILCSFERDLDVSRITQVKASGRGGPPGHGDDGDQFSYYQAVASRFDGIGGDRVHINYDDFVTLFAADDALYFESKTGLPRVRNETELIRPVQKAIREMIWRDHDHSHHERKQHRPVDWQAIADMVIARYSDRIEYLASGDLQDLRSLQSELDRALRPFIDYAARDRNAEIRRCATQYFTHLPRKLAGSAILNVTTTLCSALTKASEQELYSDALQTVRDLKTWLAWSTWKRCRGCGYHEVCFVPIWPMGGVEEFEKPRCVGNMSEASRGYWGDKEGPPDGPRKD